MSANALPDFYRQFATMIDAGLPVSRCLEVLARQSRGRLGRAAGAMHRRISSGWSLTEAAREHPFVFRSLQLSLLHAAEISGHLDLILLKMAETQEYQTQLKKQFVSKLIYPSVLLHAGILVPQVPVWFFHGTEVAIRNALQILGPIYLILFAILLIYKYGHRVPFLRSGLDAFLYYTPVLGGTVRKVAVARFASTFEALNAAGISILEALPMSAEATGNRIMEKKIKRIVPMVRSGMKLEEAAAESGAFSFMVTNMIATGAESGKLDAMLGKIAETAEYDAKVSIDRMGTIIPGIIYGLVVLYMASIILKMASQYVNTLDSLMSGK